MDPLIWNVLAVLAPSGAIYSGLLVWGLKWLLDRAARARDNRLARLEEELERERDRRAALERELFELKAALPREYVAREDWIRLSTSIDAKLDALSSKIDRLGERTHARG